MENIEEKAGEADKYGGLLGRLKEYVLDGVRQYMLSYHGVIVPDVQKAQSYLAEKISHVYRLLLVRIRPKTSLPSDSENNQNRKL